MDPISELEARFPEVDLVRQETKDGVPTAWLAREALVPALRHLQRGVTGPFRTLYDLHGVDERVRSDRDRYPAGDFTVVYHLLSYDRNEDVRLKVPLSGDGPSVPTITGLWPSANWYERELWDMFGVTVEGPFKPDSYRY